MSLVIQSRIGERNVGARRVMKMNTLGRVGNLIKECLVRLSGWKIGWEHDPGVRWIGRGRGYVVGDWLWRRDCNVEIMGSVLRHLRWCRDLE